jgi:putative oxidoreductase
MSTYFSFSPSIQNVAIGVVRIITGCLLVYHGWETFDAEKMKTYTLWFVERNYDSPFAWAYAGKIAELVAGIGFVLGLFNKLAAIAAIMAFTGIIFILGDKGKIFQGDQHPFLFILLSLLFFFAGPGSLAMDNWFFKKRKRVE